MAVDNPSYFSLASGTSSPIKVTTTTTRQTSSALSRSHGSGFSAFFRRKPCRMGATFSSGTVAGEPSASSMHHENHSSASGTSTPSTPTEERVPMLPRNGVIHSACGKRRSFRNLFRSVSANENHETTQQFLKGDPRPSDIAPPSPYLPHRSHSHSENDRRHPGKKVLKSTSELLSNDMVYCGLTGKNRNGDNNDNHVDDDDDTAEVFLGINDARYYNLSSTLPTPGSSIACQRRHSIGTFLRKEVGTSGNVVSFRRQQAAGGSKSSLEPDTVMAVSVLNDDIDGVCRREERQTSYNRNKRRRHKNSTKRGSRSATALSKDECTEDDILFVSNKKSEASNLWVNYLTACFEQISRQQGRTLFKVQHMAIEEPIAPRTEEKIRSSRLQIIVICPTLLEYIQTNSEHVVHLTSNLITDRVLVMMLGVQESHINETYRSSLVCYDQWKKFFVKDQDETFVGQLLGAAISILGTTPPPSALKTDKTAFSVHPKKVKLGQNRVIVLLNDPLSSEDNVSVIVDRCGEAIDITNVKRRNPYALQFSIPERCLDVSMLIGVRILKNGRSLGGRQVKCESRLRELDQILRAHDNPLEFMCQTFGFSSSDREQLDNWMVNAFQKNIPPHFNLLSTPSCMVPAHKSQISSEENPTLLHFAARFGLEKLAWQLLECPGSDLACDLRNASELTPADLAEQSGHMRLAHQLRGYMQMNEFTNMYSYVKVMSETTPNQTTGTDADIPLMVPNEANNDQEDYCRPRPLSEAYLVPPIARPITTLIPKPQITTTSSAIMNKPLAANYSIVPTPTPVIFPSGSTTSVISNGLDLTIQGYMKMHPTGPRTPTVSTSSLQSSRTGTPTQNIRQDCHQTSFVSREDHCSQKISQNILYGRTASNGTCRSRESSGPQDELLEIINDFKNNVFTISEVERLVENWQKRNDVQQSFKDKQRQLVAMREEYERIQKKMKEEMKTPTPFEKIRKFFSKGKKDIKESATVVSDSSSTGKSEGTSGTSADRRPISSLSLRSVSSSSSSGRMSTASGCSGTSFGDSGTHSDSDDRRNMRDEKGGIMSYEIPPTPKPFTGKYSPAAGYSSSLNISTTRNFDLIVRQRQSPSRTGKNEYYIAFPPSGLPVHAFKADSSLKEPNAPTSPCEHPKYLDFVSTDKNHEEAETMILANNSYMNIEPLASNSAPNSPAGVCVSHSNSELSSTDTLHVDQATVKNATTEANDVSTTCSNISKMKPMVIAKTAIDEIDSVLSNQDQKDTEVKCNQGYTTTDSTNILKTTNEVTERQVPDYMNVTVNINHDNVKILGAVPKKLHGPPVPPRGTSLNNV